MEDDVAAEVIRRLKPHVSSVSMRSSLDFALQPPDAGQLALDERVRAMSAAERAEHAYRLRMQAFVLVNEAADAAGPMSELDRAVFILRRLYPEYTEAHPAHIRDDLARREAAEPGAALLVPPAETVCRVHGSRPPGHGPVRDIAARRLSGGALPCAVRPLRDLSRGRGSRGVIRSPEL